jgi:hypothetical protein
VASWQASTDFQGQLGIDTANPITVRYDFQRENLVCDENFIDTNGLRGTRSRDISRVRQGNRKVHGQIVFQPTTLELSTLLPWILGGTPTGSGTVTYPLADALTSRYVNVDRVEKRFTYSGVVVNKATFRGSEGNPLELTLDLVGVDETVASTAFPSISLDTTTPPLIFTDLVLSVNSTTAQCKEFTLEIDNAVDADRFFNSQTLTSGYARDRHVNIDHPLPYGDQSALYNPGVAGVAVTATFTDGSSVLEFSLAAVDYPRHSPYAGGRNEIMMPMRGTAYKSSGTLELVTTLHN